ncbi:hypothetical protein JL722_11427 [Aureococcus anophagefferens]|nr:hypothetical protein JL722_11427 [Aureococcus anophagefferens]
MTVFLRAVGCLAAAAAAGGNAAVPKVAFTAGYNNSNCEAHPHAGVELADGGWLMVGDSVCWDGSAAYDRAVFVVATERDGAERWTRVLGDRGFNYGKYGTQLSDGTVLVAGEAPQSKESASYVTETFAGVKSVVKADAKKRGFPYVESRALWRLDETDGSTISETVFENEGRLDGARDGFMCATPAIDDPMTLKFGDRAVGADPETLFHVALNVSDAFQPMQGMRVFHGHGASDGSVVVSAASSTGPFDENYGFHFSAMAVDDATGALKWARIYEAGLHASHPYALVLSPAGDVVIAGLAVPSADDDFYNPVGRLLKARGGDGAQVFDARQKDRETRDYNVECYGVDNAPASGFVVTCGNGPEAPPKWMDCHEAAWDACLYETDADGKTLWAANLTDASAECINDAGEFVVTAHDGGFAVYVDSGTLGRPGTGGNFGLVRLAAE